MKEVVLSVGIDIGTSTTQVVFSNITVENLASDFSVPRIEIVDKQIIYRSDIYFTPLLSPTQIDMAGVRKIVAAEYAKAGVDKKKIQTGAVVITGETARKENANEVLLHLSEFAGDFVVATAGPDLESIIAGRGAGADLYSKQHSTTVANYDIGGGTSNFALFSNGNLLSTGCLDIGGRLIKVDQTTKRITYIAPKIQKLMQWKGIDLAEGSTADLAKLQRVVQAMADLLAMSLGLMEKDAFYPTILTREGHDLPLPQPIRHLCFSGGVADYIYHPTTEDIFRYGDIGILLGQAIASSPAFAKIPRIPANETIRATVVGAGSHITEISGSTIDYDLSILPSKNLPILKLSPEEEVSGQSIAQAISRKLRWFEVDGVLQQAAIAMTGKRSPSFKEITEVAQGIVEGAAPIYQGGMPLVVVVEHDMAKVLGQSINSLLDYRYPVLCIDAIRVDQGDYIDIGKPIANGSVLPVVIKTLVFK